MTSLFLHEHLQNAWKLTHKRRLESTLCLQANIAIKHHILPSKSEKVPTFIRDSRNSDLKFPTFQLFDVRELEILSEVGNFGAAQHQHIHSGDLIDIISLTHMWLNGRLRNNNS